MHGMCAHCEERHTTQPLLDNTYVEPSSPEADEWVCEQCYDIAVDRSVERALESAP